MFENTGAGTILLEEDMTISMANSCFERIIGFSRERFEDRVKLTEFIHPEDRERLQEYHHARCRGQHVPSDYQCRVSTAHSGLRHMAVRAQIISGTRRSVVSFMDITDLVRSKEALERSEQRLANLMNNLPGMAYRYAAEGQQRFEFASKGCFQLTGYRKSQLIGGSGPAFADLIHPDDRRQVVASVSRALDKGEPFQLTYRLRTVSGTERWVWDQGAGFFSSAGRPIAVEGFITDFTLYKQMEQKFLKREQWLRNENEKLRSSAAGVYGLGDLVGKSEPMRQVYRMIQKAAAMDTSVIIYGESGTGKELVARCIHSLSDRCNGNFVAVNCGAVPESIFESEFFGCKKGAFSGAVKDAEGYLDAADGGTLFLDEVGEISLAGQVKLLRVIDNGGYSPVGGRTMKHPKLRIIAATNRNLKTLVENGAMREDFFFRIHILPIRIPPLRDRKEDILLLVDRILKNGGFGDMPLPTGDTLRQLMAYDWPGNVRELQNTIHRYMTVNSLDFLTPQAPDQAPLPADGDPLPNDSPQTLRTSVREFEKRYILKLLNTHQWHRSKVAKLLGIDRRTLLRKIQTLGIG